MQLFAWMVQFSRTSKQKRCSWDTPETFKGLTCSFIVAVNRLKRNQQNCLFLFQHHAASTTLLRIGSLNFFSKLKKWLSDDLWQSVDEILDNLLSASESFQDENETNCICYTPLAKCKWQFDFVSILVQLSPVLKIWFGGKNWMFLTKDQFQCWMGSLGS